MDVERELNGKLLPDLAAVVADFYVRFPPSRRDMVVEYSREAPTYRTAARRACASRDRRGKMHNHQSRVPHDARMELYVLLKRNYLRAVRCGTFDEFHDLVQSVAPKGIGPVTTYDVSVRLGAWLGLEPLSVYLHAGVRAGWETLTGVRSNGQDRLTVDDLPPEFAVLPADDVEDILCTYRTIFAGWRHETQ